MTEVADMFEAVQSQSLLEEFLVFVPKLTSIYDELSGDELLKEMPRLRRHLKAAYINLQQAKHWPVLILFWNS